MPSLFHLGFLKVVVPVSMSLLLRAVSTGLLSWQLRISSPVCCISGYIVDAQSLVQNGVWGAQMLQSARLWADSGQAEGMPVGVYGSQTW